MVKPEDEHESKINTANDQPSENRDVTLEHVDTKQQKKQQPLSYDKQCGIFPDPNKIETTMAKSKRLRKPVQTVVLDVNWSGIFNEELLVNSTKWKYDPTATNAVEKGMDAWTLEIFSPAECSKLIELCEMYGFEDCGYPKGYRSNTRLITQDQDFADVLYDRIKQCCPQKYKSDGGIWEICGLNGILFASYLYM